MILAGTGYPKHMLREVDLPILPQEPTSPDEITVYVGVRTDTETWLSSQAVTVKSDATVYHAFVEALDKSRHVSDGSCGRICEVHHK